MEIQGQGKEADIRARGGRRRRGGHRGRLAAFSEQGKAAHPHFQDKPSQVTSGDVWHGDPALSPDGGTIAYASDESGNKDIYIINVGGGNPLRLTDDPARRLLPGVVSRRERARFRLRTRRLHGIWKIGTLGGGATLLAR